MKVNTSYSSCCQLHNISFRFKPVFQRLLGWQFPRFCGSFCKNDISTKWSWGWRRASHPSLSLPNICKVCVLQEVWERLADPGHGWGAVASHRRMKNLKHNSWFYQFNNHLTILTKLYYMYIKVGYGYNKNKEFFFYCSLSKHLK